MFSYNLSDVKNSFGGEIDFLEVSIHDIVVVHKSDMKPITGLIKCRSTNKTSGYVLNGKIISDIKEWYSNGQLKFICETNKSKNEIITKAWYSDGRVKAYSVFGNNLNGYAKQWHINGKIKKYVTIRNGKRHGYWKEWHDNGKSRVVAKYNNGELVNVKYFYSDGSQAIPQQYDDFL